MVQHQEVEKNHFACSNRLTNYLWKCTWEYSSVIGFQLLFQRMCPQAVEVKGLHWNTEMFSGTYRMCLLLKSETCKSERYQVQFKNKIAPLQHSSGCWSIWFIQTVSTQKHSCDLSGEVVSVPSARLALAQLCGAEQELLESGWFELRNPLSLQ